MAPAASAASTMMPSWTGSQIDDQRRASRRWQCFRAASAARSPRACGFDRHPVAATCQVP